MLKLLLLVRRAGHSIKGEFKEGSTTAVGTRADNGDTITVTWTMEMAERAGLAKKQNWRQYPEAMLWARAVSQLCRMLFADCFAGATYTTEEMGEENTTATGEPIIEDDGLFPPPGVAEGLTEDQAKKLNVLVGTLRTAGHITTEQLWLALRMGQDWPRDEDGVLHWAPLRNSLTKTEASGLIERLQRKTEASGLIERLQRIEDTVRQAEEPKSDLAEMAEAAQANRARAEAS